MKVREVLEYPLPHPMNVHRFSMLLDLVYIVVAFKVFNAQYDIPFFSCVGGSLGYHALSLEILNVSWLH
jgi:hypothetical protein